MNSHWSWLIAISLSSLVCLAVFGVMRLVPKPEKTTIEVASAMAAVDSTPASPATVASVPAAAEIPSAEDADAEGRDEQNEFSDEPAVVQATASNSQPDHSPSITGDDAVACSAGLSQSPINIEQPLATRELRPLIFQYSNVPEARKVGRGAGRKIDFQTTRQLFRYQSRDFVLRSMSIKFPSEHMVDGQQFAAEIQFHHQAQNGGELLNLSIFLQGGSASDWSEPFLTFVKGENEFALSNLIPEDKSYYEYRGSITEPPCQEGVTWVIMKKPLFAADEVLEQIRAELGAEARPLQAVNQRRARMSSRYLGTNGRSEQRQDH
jgi:carbonic anhydrase